MIPQHRRLDEARAAYAAGVRYSPKIDARTHPLDRALDGTVFPTHRSVFLNLAGEYSYPPALAAMVERRDRFVKNAARLDKWHMTTRERAKASRWRRAAERERRRIKKHPHFDK